MNNKNKTSPELYNYFFKEFEIYLYINQKTIVLRIEQIGL